MSPRRREARQLRPIAPSLRGANGSREAWHDGAEPGISRFERCAIAHHSSMLRIARNDELNHADKSPKPRRAGDRGEARIALLLGEAEAGPRIAALGDIIADHEGDRGLRE